MTPNTHVDGNALNRFKSCEKLFKSIETVEQAQRFITFNPTSEQHQPESFEIVLHGRACRVVPVPSREGAYVILDALSRHVQVELIQHCLVDCLTPPNVTNLHAHSTDEEVAQVRVTSCPMPGASVLILSPLTPRQVPLTSSFFFHHCCVTFPSMVFFHGVRLVIVDEPVDQGEENHGHHCDQSAYDETTQTCHPQPHTVGDFGVPVRLDGEEVRQRCVRTVSDRTGGFLWSSGAFAR